MARRDHTLLKEIERDLLEENPLASVLRKVVVLGGRAGSGELRDWASRELQGYAGTEDPIPDYRRVAAQIRLDGMSGRYKITGQPISVSDLPDFAQEHIEETVTLPFAVAELEAAARSSGDDDDKSLRLALPMAVELARVMDSQSGQPFQSITALYWAVSRQSIFGVVDKIRTKLAELVAELIASMPDDQDHPTAEQAAAAVHFVVTGKRSTVNFANAQATGGGDATLTQSVPGQPAGADPPWWTLGRKIGAFIVGVAIIATGVLTYLLYVKG